MAETKTLTFLESYALLLNDIEAIKKDKKNDYHGNDYTTISAVIGHIKPKLNKHGFVIQQLTSILNGEQILTTKLIHVHSAESIESISILPMKEKGNPQHLGSALTYTKRYHLKALLLMTETDDDGNGAAGKVSGVEVTTKVTMIGNIKTRKTLTLMRERFESSLDDYSDDGQIRIEDAFNKRESELSASLEKTVLEKTLSTISACKTLNELSEIDNNVEVNFSLGADEKDIAFKLINERKGQITSNKIGTNNDSN